MNPLYETPTGKLRIREDVREVLIENSTLPYRDTLYPISFPPVEYIDPSVPVLAEVVRHPLNVSIPKAQVIGRLFFYFDRPNRRTVYFRTIAGSAEQLVRTGISVPELPGSKGLHLWFIPQVAPEDPRFTVYITYKIDREADLFEYIQWHLQKGWQPIQEQLDQLFGGSM
jgi:hypothetical protein